MTQVFQCGAVECQLSELDLLMHRATCSGVIDF